MKNREFVLGSSSPRRSELLSMIGLKFRIITPEIDESPAPGEPPWEFVKRAALEKLEAVRRKVDGEMPVLTADTVVFINGKILGKPSDEKEAVEFLKMLSGNWHRVYTGYALWCGKKLYRRSVKSKVKIMNLSDEIIEWYVSTGEPLDKAGAYAVQGIGSFMIEAVRGSYSNVVGLPLTQVVKDMIKCGLIYFKDKK